MYGVTKRDQVVDAICTNLVWAGKLAPELFASYSLMLHENCDNGELSTRYILSIQTRNHYLQEYADKTIVDGGSFSSERSI